MNVSQNGINLIKKYEGFRADAYQDGGGVWTVGYGTTFLNGRKVQKGDHLDEPAASEVMITTANEYLQTVSKFLKVALDQNKIDAIACFIYNLGCEQFEASTLLRMINSGDYSGAADQFSRWIYDNGKVVQGLVRRRAAERALFLQV